MPFKFRPFVLLPFVLRGASGFIPTVTVSEASNQVAQRGRGRLYDESMQGQPRAPEETVERRIVTVLFADLVGFTTLSERFDPEDIALIQDRYFATVRETIGRYGGRLEKFIGDAAMAVFGVPRSRDDDAVRAVRAGLALINGVQQISTTLGLEEDALRVRVGINTGEAVIAFGGPDVGRVTGDTVNTAARLQTAAPPDEVLVGEATALAVAEVADFGPPQALELKGKAEPTDRANCHRRPHRKPRASRRWATCTHPRLAASTGADDTARCVPARGRWRGRALARRRAAWCRQVAPPARAGGFRSIATAREWSSGDRAPVLIRSRRSIQSPGSCSMR